MKSAIIVTFNYGFIKGFNGIINGLDYHGNTCDVHYIHDKALPKNYIEASQKTFPFGVYPHLIDDLIKKYPMPPHRVGTVWPYYFYKYILAAELQEYDAICVMDADSLINAYLMNYFRVVANSDLIIMAHNHFTFTEVENGVQYVPENEFEDKSKALHANPSFMNPKKYKYLYEKIWEYGREYGADATAIRKALYTTDNIKNVLTLPGYFFSNPPFKDAEMSYGNINNKYGFFLFRERLKIIHRKWWYNPEEPGEMYEEWKKTSEEKKDICMTNMKNLHKESRRINTEWKLKINWDTCELL